MRKRGARPLKELYDLTDTIVEPEGMFTAEKRCMFVNEKLHPRTDSGTCNVCSAPCSSCMHLNRTASVMESNVDCPFPGNTFGIKEDDSCSFIGVDGFPFHKSRTCDDNQHAASETSNLLSASSSHDSYSENAESKATLRTSFTHEASDAVYMPSKVSSSAEAGDDLPNKTNATFQSLFSSQSHVTCDLSRKTFSSRDEEQRGSECHGDNISCITAFRDANAAVLDHNVDLDKKDVVCSSASTGSLLAKGIDDEVQVEVAHGFHDHEIEESQSNSRSPSTCQKESLQKKSTGSNPANASISDKPELAEFPPSKNIPSPKVQSPRFHSQKGYSFHHNADSKDVEGNPSSQFQVEPFECSMENVESSSGLLAAGSVNEWKLAALPNYENSEASYIRIDNSSAALKDMDPCMETEIGMDGGISSDEVMKCSRINEQHENSNAFVEASNILVPQVQAQLNVEGENSESDSGLDDVKVCDICGDSGREELLAICSRCSDGAEHTYCMRKKLDKLPEGDWLCEECKTKEDTEIQKADKSETVSETSKPTCLNENSQNLRSTFNRKLLPKLNTKAVDLEARGVIKGPQSPQISSTRHADNLVDSSVTSKKASEDLEARGVIKGPQSPQISSTRHADNLVDSSVTSKKASEASGGSIGTASPRKKTVLSRENSFKNLDMGKVKAVNMGSSFGGQSANNGPTFSRLQTSLGSNSFKIQAQLQSPRVPVSRSNSFNNSNLKPTPKVKQLTENAPHKLKPVRESTSGDSRKEGLVRTMTKSASFKSGSSDRSNIESFVKTQFLNPSQGEDSRGSKQVKERNVIEKKNYSAPDCPLVCPSPLAGTGIPLPKVDLKVEQHDGRLKNTSESKSLSINKVSDDANDIGCKEVKKQSSYLSKNFGSQSSNRMSNSVDQKPCQVSKDGVGASSTTTDRSCSKAVTVLQRAVTQAVESALCDDKTKDAMLCNDKTKESTLFNSSKQVVSGGNRLLHCQRCNEIGHATQFCPIDKLSASALKPSAEWNLKEGITKSNKWKDAVEATNMKTGIQRNNTLPDQSEEFQSPTADLSCEAPSKDILSSSSSCPGDLPFLEGRIHGQGSDAVPSKTTDIDTRQQAMQPVEASYVPTASGSNVILSVPDDSNVKSSIHILTDQASILTNSIRASAIPELEFIWQGSFEVLRNGRLPELFDGIQAHLSTCASPKVLEVVTKFPCKVQLEEVPRISSWPSQFQGTSPKEDNIALFFFAKDIESYEKNYSKLLQNMLRNDLALRGNIDGVELLIFPSNGLPANSQCWNRLFYLWGVFRGRKKNCLEDLPGFQKKPCGSILCTDPLVQDLRSLLINDMSNSQKIDSCENWDMELSWCDRSSKAKAVISTTSVDCWSISSSGVDDRTSNTELSTLVGNSLYQAVADSKLPLEHTSFPVNCSLKSMNQLPSLLDSCPEPRLQLSAKMFCREGNIGAIYLKNSGTASERGKVAEPPSHIHAQNVETGSRALHANVDSSNCRQGAEGRSEEKMRQKEKLMRSVTALEDDPWENLTERDHPSCESRPSRKRTHSFSTEMVSRASSETSRSTDETKLLKEKANCIYVEDGREHKKTKRNGEGHASSSFGDENLSGRPSSKVHPLIFLNEKQQHRGGVREETVMPENSRGAERCLFPVELGPVRHAKQDNVIHLSSDDEGMPESNAPFLELALGGEKKPGHHKALPLLFPLADRYGNQDRPPGPGEEEDDEQKVLPLLFPLDRNGSQDMPPGPATDDEASLSLSLGFPSTHSKPVLKTEQMMPDGPHVNTCLLLFSGFPDS